MKAFVSGTRGPSFCELEARKRTTTWDSWMLKVCTGDDGVCVSSLLGEDFFSSRCDARLDDVGTVRPEKKKKKEGEICMNEVDSLNGASCVYQA